MSRREWVTPEGLRGDGRRARELRRVRVALGVLPHADGSACVEMGNTKVDVRGVGGGSGVERGPMRPPTPAPPPTPPPASLPRGPTPGRTRTNNDSYQN